MVYVSLTSDTYATSHADPWVQKTVDIWANALEINVTFEIEKSRGTVAFAQLSEIDLILSNGSTIALDERLNFSVGTLVTRSFHFNFNETLPIRAVQLNFNIDASNYARLLLEIHDMTMGWFGYDGMIVEGLPDGGTLQVYVGETLVERLPCDGSDLKVALGASLPLECRLELTQPPPSNPVASYSSTLGWRDRLDLVDGILCRSDTGVEMINVSRASECDNDSGWSYRWNLTTGGTTPAFSTQSGHLVASQVTLASKGTLPTIEAYYWFDYPLDLIANDYAISISADATFHFTTNGILLSKFCEISLYAISNNTVIPLAASERSLNPQLLTSVSLSPSSTTSVEKLVVEVHAYARSSIFSILQSVSNIARIDYLRINCSSMPDGYPNVHVAGLTPGQYVLCDGSRFWSNSSGSAIVPISGGSWSSGHSLQVFNSSECYPCTFIPDGAYCPVEARIKSAFSNKAFISVSAPSYSYCEELMLLSLSRGIDKSGMYVTMDFLYRILDNGTTLEPRMIELYIDGSQVNVVKNSFCSYTVRFNVYPDAAAVRLTAVTESGIMIRSAVRL